MAEIDLTRKVYKIGEDVDKIGEDVDTIREDVDKLSERVEYLISLIETKLHLETGPDNASTSKPAEHAGPSTSSGATQSKAKPSAFGNRGYQEPIPTSRVRNNNANVEAPPPGNEDVQSEKTEKFKKMVSEPMGNKSVNKLPGVGKAVEGKLKKRGFSQASQLYALYLKSTVQFRSRMVRYDIGEKYLQEIETCFETYRKKYQEKIV